MSRYAVTLAPTQPVLIALICVQAACRSVSVDTVEPMAVVEAPELVRDRRVDGDLFNARHYRGRVEVEGIMQAYWRPIGRSQDGHGFETQLEMRFFLDAEESERLATVVAGDTGDAYDRTPRILGFYRDRESESGELRFDGLEQLASEVLKHFEDLPDEFLVFREGQVAQRGRLVFRDLSSVIECDAPYSLVRFESFRPEPEIRPDETAESRLRERARAAGGCAAEAPYDETFAVEGEQPLHVAPDASAASAGVVADGEIVVKLRTIDESWVEVTTYPERETRGFLLQRALSPID